MSLKKHNVIKKHNITSNREEAKTLRTKDKMIVVFDSTLTKEFKGTHAIGCKN